MTLLAGARVLIVEDEAIIAMTAEDMIEELGGVVAGVCATLDQARVRAGLGDFDLALLDINLNGTPSLPIAAMLQARGTPFLFTTGYGGVGLGSDFASAPVIAKPYRLRDLANGLTNLLGQEPASPPSAGSDATSWK